MFSYITMRSYFLVMCWSFDLNDGLDVTRELNCKANCVVCTFASCFVKYFLVKLYCLTLYGWHLGSHSLRVSLSKVRQKGWHLPSQSHVHVVFGLTEINDIYDIFMVD